MSTLLNSLLFPQLHAFPTDGSVINCEADQENSLLCSIETSTTAALYGNSSKAPISVYPPLSRFSPELIRDKGLTADERNRLTCIATVNGAGVASAVRVAFPAGPMLFVNREKLSRALKVAEQCNRDGSVTLDVYAQVEGQHYIPMNDVNGLLNSYISVNVLRTPFGDPVIRFAPSIKQFGNPSVSTRNNFDDVKIMMGAAAAAVGPNEQRRQSSYGDGGGRQSRFLVTPDRTMIVSVGPDGSWDITSSAERLRGLVRTESTSNKKPIFAAILSADGKRELVFLKKNNQMKSVCIAQPLFKTRVVSPIRSQSPSPRGISSQRSNMGRRLNNFSSPPRAADVYQSAFLSTTTTPGAPVVFRNLSNVNGCKRAGIITTPVGQEFGLKYGDVGDLKLIKDPEMNWLEVNTHFIPPRVVKRPGVTEIDGVPIKDDLREYDENIRWKIYVKLLKERDARFALQRGDRKICYFDVTAKPPLLEESTHYRPPIPKQSMLVSGLIKTVVEVKGNGQAIKEKSWQQGDIVIDKKGNMTNAESGARLLDSDVVLPTL